MVVFIDSATDLPANLDGCREEQSGCCDILFCAGIQALLFPCTTNTVCDQIDPYVVFRAKGADGTEGSAQTAALQNNRNPSWGLSKNLGRKTWSSYTIELWNQGQGLYWGPLSVSNIAIGSFRQPGSLRYTISMLNRYVCPAGKQMTSLPDNSDPTCTECALNATFKSQVGMGLCLAVKNCGVGTYSGQRVLTNPTLSSDRECTSCTLGSTFQNNS